MALLSAALCSAAPNGKVPDFTKGEVLDPNHKKKKYYDRAMGPTGLWGEVDSQDMANGASRDARQFRITKVEAGSPAEGKIKLGDVVIGASGRNFDSDARKLLAAAIQKAEETNGNLSLRIWREGKTFEQTLKLKVMGAYDPNNPFNCAYTDAVIDHMAAHSLKLKLSQNSPAVKRISLLSCRPWLRSACWPLAKKNSCPRCVPMRMIYAWIRKPRSRSPLTFPAKGDEYGTPLTG